MEKVKGHERDILSVWTVTCVIYGRGVTIGETYCTELALPVNQSLAQGRGSWQNTCLYFPLIPRFLEMLLLLLNVLSLSIYKRSHLLLKWFFALSSNFKIYWHWQLIPQIHTRLCLCFSLVGSYLQITLIARSFRWQLIPHQFIASSDLQKLHSVVSCFWLRLSIDNPFYTLMINAG